MARARGSYPRCRGFESPPRYLNRGVAQVVERHVRDVEAASSSLVTPTKNRICESRSYFFTGKKNLLSVYYLDIQYIWGER